MNEIPQIVTHYADGRPSEIRDMTPEEIAELKTGLLDDEELPDTV
tara:strand:- start:224 stop:358 length:135 start_codon:yes stop_codon:yes gene_type:complete